MLFLDSGKGKSDLQDPAKPLLVVAAKTGGATQNIHVLLEQISVLGSYWREQGLLTPFSSRFRRGALLVGFV